MGRFGRKLLPVFVVSLFAFALPALASNVTVNGTTNFSSLDGSVDDQDHVVNGIFTVNGDLIVNGTINCNDDSPGNSAACSMRFNVTGNVIMNAGSGMFAENRHGNGNGGNITINAGGSVTLHGPASNLSGAVMSGAAFGSANGNGGTITINSGGATTLEAGTVINSGSKGSDAGKILLTAGGSMTVSGLLAAGASSTLLATRQTGDILDGGVAHQHGGEIRVQSTSVFEPAITITSTATIASQGKTEAAGPVTIEGCGVIIRGLVASIVNDDAATRVAIRSGKGITIDATDLGINSSGTRLGHLRADATSGGAAAKRLDLFAAEAIQITGPDPSLSTLYAASSAPANDHKVEGGKIRAISLRGTVTGSGRVFLAGTNEDSNIGGSIDISSQGTVNLDHGYLEAVGDFGKMKKDAAGGHITARSYSGNVSWTLGLGDVRPVGADASGVASQGTIALTACGTVTISGTTFPTNGPAVGVFPTITTGSCSPSAPSLPAGEPVLPVCCNVITVTNPAVTSGPAGVPFSQTFTQTGAIGTATFTLATGTLPTGLTLATNGTLSGTPTVTGSFPITVMVTDSQGCTGVGPTYPLQIVCPTITVTNPAVNSGVASSPFSQTFTQSGGVGTTTFSLASGALPAGLTLASNGVLSGTPTQTGSFPITVKATDANGCTGTGPTYTLTITCQTITVTNPAVNSGVAGAPFSQTFTQSGGIGTTTFSLASGTLPAGLTLAANGTLSGSPTQTGTFAITVKATDANGCTGTGPTYTLTITCQTITVTNPAVNSGVAGAPFSQTFTQSGGIGTTTFSLASGTLPAGLTLAANGTLSGTPTQTGTFPITVKATDSNGCNGTGATYTLTIACQTITVTNPAVNTGVAGSPFSQTFTQSGGIGTTTFSLASGTLPSGLTLAANGTLSGTPMVTGTFPITVTVTDANGCTGTGPTYNLVINCQTITVTAPAVNSGVAGSPFSQTFTQSGAIGSATFSLAAGTLPSGITLAINGGLSGTPMQTGTFPITVKVTDANGCTGTTNYTLTIACQVITVTNPAVNSGVAGSPFSQTFTQSGAIGTATFSLAGGSLPTGLSLSASGALSGTPTQTGSFPITVAVTDANGCSGVGPTYNLTIACQTITVTNPSTNIGIAGQAFSQSFTQSGGIGTTTFTLASGTLPSGLSLAANGTLSGIPLQTGTFPITVTVTDANGCTGTSATYNLTINCQTITVTHPANMSGTVGVAFSEQYTQSGGIGTVVFSTVSTLPTGMTLAADGTLSGTPTQSGSFPITVTATDSNGCTGSDTFTLTIGCQTITVTNPAVSTGTAGAPFSQTFTQSGANGTATFSLASGTLPAGLSLSASGVLSGTPTQTGSFPITVKVTDSNGCTGTGPTYTLVIACQTITVTNPATTTGTVGTAFSQAFAQSGGIGAVTFSTSSTLPTGLSLSASGVLSGTPTQPGTFPITVTVTDSNGCTGTGPTYTLVIVCQTITVTNPATTTGTVDAPFSATFTQSGAIGTATFTIASGSLPAGLTLSSSGVLSGTPQAPGSFSITVKVTDSNGCTGTGPTYTLVVACQTITVTNPSSNSGTFGAPLSGSFTFTQTGVGTHTPAVFSINSGSLPTGVSLSSGGVLSGTPTQTGVFSVTVKVTDANGCTGIGSTYTLTIAPNLTTKSYVDVGNTQLDGGLPAPATPTVLSVAVSSGDSSDAPITYAVSVPPFNGTLTTFNPNGTFLYTPNVGNTSSDSFTYTGTSNGITVTRSATITFTGRVWYVDNATVSGTNDGRSNTPFKTMTAVGAAATASGDFIYVSKGSGLTTGAYTMLTSQQLIGAGATLTVGGVLTVPGAGANTPTLSGTLTLATNVTVNGIDMSTGGANSITGTSVSGINVTARNVTTTTGTPVTILNGAGTMTFTQINAGTSAAGPLNAISLTNYVGGFTVTGDGSNASNGSGGTIQKTTGNAVNLSNITGAGVSLSSMIIKTSAHDGIHGTVLNNFALLGCQVLNNGTTLVDNGVHLVDVSGAATFTNDTVTGSFLNNVWLDASVSSTAVMTSLTVTNGTYSSSANDDGFLVSLKNAASINTATFTGATFSNNFAKGLQLQQNDNSVLGNGVGAPTTGTITVTGCTFTNNNVGASFEGGGGTNGTGSVYFRFVNNTNILGSQSDAVNFANGSDSGGGTFKAFVSGNVIGNAGVANSGSAFGNGMRFFLQGQQTATVTIVNNTIRQIPFGRGIDVEELGRPGPAHGQTRLDVKITGNDVNPQDTTGFPLYAIYVSSDAQGTGTSGSNVNAEIHGNTVPASPDACDTLCGPGTGMIVYEKAAGATGTQVATLFNAFGGATVNAEIANNNTGTAGKTCTQGSVTLTATPPNTVN
ncbi:MAG TPA: putative Ig domain-containing protein [Thermoanaerobaculia bacterium]|nr:putative Ig domain-containing protein [Thermoanaerobaculia bacterium]